MRRAAAAPAAALALGLAPRRPRPEAEGAVVGVAVAHVRRGHHRVGVVVQVGAAFKNNGISKHHYKWNFLSVYRDWLCGKA